MLNIETYIDGNIARLAFKGRFEFSGHREFRRVSEEMVATHGINEVEVDLAQVDYLDSSALGMLLLLNKKCKEKQMSVSILNGKGIVADILRVAQFEKFFTIR